MDVGTAVTFVKDDKRWLSKLLIGAVIAFFSFLLIPIPFLAGYSLAVSRNVMNGDPDPLPEWEDWGKLFMDGLYVMIAQFVYTLPFWILACIGFVATIGFGGLGELSEEAAAAGILATFGVMGCLVILLWIALIFISPAIYIQYVRTDEFGACFRFGEVFGIARNYLGDILITVVFALAVSIVLGVATGILNIIPCLGWILSFVLSILAGPWIMVSIGHLYGQIAAKMGGKEEKFASEM
jgi:hypothetical protein